MDNSNICPKCHQPRVRLTDGTFDCGWYVNPNEYPEGYPSADNGFHGIPADYDHAGDPDKWYVG